VDVLHPETRGDRCWSRALTVKLGVQSGASSVIMRISNQRMPPSRTGAGTASHSARFD
jgi:hypothetical protein